MKKFLLSLFAMVATVAFAAAGYVSLSSVINSAEDDEDLEVAVSPAFTYGEEEVALNSHSEVSVDKADGLVVNFENMPNVLGASYAINVMKATEDENGVTWNADESFDIAVGEMSVNGRGFVDFEDLLVFELGQKYQLKVTVYLNNGTETPDEEVHYYVFNGSSTTEMEIEPALVLGDEEVTLNAHSEASVDAAEGLKVNVINCPEAIGISYAINAMKAVEDEEGTTWVADESYDVAVGEASMNTIAYAKFDDVIYFEQGQKYQVKVTVYGQPTETPAELGTYYYVINGSHVEEMEIEPALVLGDEEVTLNAHSEASVDAAEGLKVNVINCPEAIGISYAINVMKAVESEEGTTWVADESYDVAVGEASMNTIAYAKFDDVIYFEQGQKYQVKVTVYGQPTETPAELGTYYYVINGSHVEEMEIEPALVLGDEEVTLNAHSEASVDAAEGLKVNVINCPEAIGISYAINVMKAVESEEGTTWVADESYDVAVGESSLNTIGYAEFDDVIYFEQGQKYQVKVTVYGQPADAPAELGTYYYIVNGAHEKVQSELMAYILGGGLFTISSNGMNLNFNNQDVTWTEEASNYQFAVEAPQEIEGEDYNDQYVLRIYENGKPRDFWGQQAHYLNFQPEGGNIIFGLWNNNQNGTDAKNHAIFTIEENEEGILFKNVARGLYLSADGMSADAATCVVTPWGVADGINAIEFSAKNGKYLQNGKVVIVKNGKMYNTMGNMVK